MAQVRARTIEDDGECMIPEFHHDAVVYVEHMVRYLFASRFVAGKTVLDVASGVGYGQHGAGLLARTCSSRERRLNAGIQIPGLLIAGGHLRLFLAQVNKLGQPTPAYPS